MLFSLYPLGFIFMNGVLLFRRLFELLLFCYFVLISVVARCSMVRIFIFLCMFILADTSFGDLTFFLVSVRFCLLTVEI